MSITDDLSPPQETDGAPPLNELEPSKPLSPATIFWYSLANLGCGAFYSFNNYVLPLFLQQFTKNAVLLGIMGSTHSVEGAVIQPLVGSASDRLRSPWGRRRPFMLLFMPLSALFLILTPAAGHLPGSMRLGVIVLCIFLFTVFFNIAFDPYQALMPDITPEPQRGRVTGIWALVGNFAQAFLPLMFLLPGMTFSLEFWVVAIAILATTFLTCAMVREPRVPAIAATKHTFLQEIREALTGLKTLRQAAIAIAVFGISGAGIGAVVPNLTIFVKTITHCDNSHALLMGFVLMISTVVGVAPFGWLADRIGAKRVVFIGLTLIGIAALNALWITTLAQVTIVMIIAGLGNAGQAASSYPLLTDLVPGEEVGFYTGFQSTALSIAQPLTVVLAGMLINRGQGSYRLIFAVCAASIFIAVAVLALVRVREAPAEIAARRAERRLSEA